MLLRGMMQVGTAATDASHKLRCKRGALVAQGHCFKWARPGRDSSNESLKHC